MESPTSTHIPGKFTVASVSFLNAKPLLFGLHLQSDIQLMLDVPARLLDGIRADRFDVALLPTIDYQRHPGLRVIPAGGIGCDGATLTVRIFSRNPIQQINVLACDTDSHTSVALAQIILAETYGIRPKLVDLRHGIMAEEDARLLIGDKVVCEEPVGYPHQLDLGEAWKQLTGLPFVFAVWMARPGVELGNLPTRLESAKRQGRLQIESIIQEYAVPRGWPIEIARHYLNDYLQYDIGPGQIQAMRLFHQLAFRHGITEFVRDLDVVPA